MIYTTTSPTIGVLYTKLNVRHHPPYYHIAYCLPSGVITPQFVQALLSSGIPQIILPPWNVTPGDEFFGAKMSLPGVCYINYGTAYYYTMCCRAVGELGNRTPPVHSVNGNIHCISRTKT